MLIKEDEVSKRLNNPLNLINQMKGGLNKKDKNNAMSLFIRPASLIISEEKQKEKAGDFLNINSTTADNQINSSELIPDSEAKMKLALAHDKALKVMTDAIDAAGLKLDDIRADRLPGVIVAMSKVVGNIRAERIERDKVNKGNDVHLHFYCPEQKKIDSYEVIDVAS